MKELAVLFLKLGIVAFGGPAAHIALMENTVVQQRGWLTQQEFLDLLGAANLLPGPSSTELAIFIGYKREGWKGLILAGVCFIFPAMLIVWFLAKLYVKIGSLPTISGVFYGIKPVTIAIIVQAILGLAKSAIKSRILALIAVVALALNILGTNALLVLLVGGLMSLLLSNKGQFRQLFRKAWVILIAFFTGVYSSEVLAAASTTAIPQPTLVKIFLFFTKLGAVVYGSGYVLLAFLQTDLVNHWHWLSQAQLLDAVAVGQFTPGPVFTTATFIGYLLGGTPGAIVATIGIFLPAFVLVLMSGRIIPRIRKSSFAGSFLDGINIASLALMAVVTTQLANGALVDGITIILALVSFSLLRFLRFNSIWVLIGGGIVGLAKLLGT